MKWNKYVSVILFGALIAVSLFLAFSCSNTASYAQHILFAMDTVIEIDLPVGSESSLFQQCEELIRSSEALFSKTTADSDVSHFNCEESRALISEETGSLIAEALRFSRETGGAFDITVEPLSALWDVTGAAPRVPDESEITDALQSVGYEKLSLILLEDEAELVKSNPSTRIDLGAIAKGYTCSQLVQYLMEEGVPYGKLSFGGNLGLFGEKPDGTPWRVGIKNPLAPDTIAAYISVPARFVSVSGDYERYFEADGKRYHHIIDPHDGYPADNGICSAVVVAEDGALADALSTALFVMGKDEAITFSQTSPLSFEAVLFCKDGTVWASSGLRPSLELNGSDFSLIE